MGDLLEPDWLHLRLAAVLAEKNQLLERAFAAPRFELAAVEAQALEWGRRLAPYITDTTALLQRALADDELVLLEGAQGTLLDVDQGTYPYVTSSNTVAGGACTGAGLGPLQIDQVIGVLKAYSTRVGAGPFPTELEDGVGEGLRQRGREFGTTTGRPRRCGWLDLVPLRRAVAINSASAMMLNKIDILSGLAEIKACVAYRIDGQIVEESPLSLAQLERAEPVYETFPGWPEDISAARTVADLPAAARRLVAAIEERAGAPIALISVGPERTQTLVNDRAAPALAAAAASMLRVAR
jgi:adenylosuccinate synthase